VKSISFSSVSLKKFPGYLRIRAFDGEFDYAQLVVDDGIYAHGFPPGWKELARKRIAEAHAR